jgi:ABC-2 type transport system permease protein
MIGDSLIIYKREMLIFKSNIRSNIVRSIIFPLVIIIFLGNLGFSTINTPVAVVNYANNFQSMQFMNALQNQQHLKITSLSDESTALSELKNGAAQIVIIILPTFPGSGSTPSIQIYYSNSQFTESASAVPYIESVVSEFSSRVAANGQQIMLPQKGSSTYAASALYANKGNYRDFLTAGVIAMVVIFGALFGGGLSIITDKQLGNLKAFLITPINKDAIIVGKIMSGVTTALLYAFLALAIGILAGVNVAMGFAAIPFVALTAILLGIGFSAMSFAFASKINKVEIYAIVSQAIGLPLWFLSGGLMPITSLPSWMQPIAIFNPATYANLASQAVIMQGFFPINSIITDYSIMAVFAIIMVAISFKTFKSTIE